MFTLQCTPSIESSSQAQVALAKQTKITQLIVNNATICNSQSCYSLKDAYTGLESDKINFIDIYLRSTVLAKC